MAITRSVWIDDDGSGTTGTPLNNAELQKIYNNIDAGFGVWTPVPFNAADFTANTGTWTLVAASTTFAYVVLNTHTLLVTFKTSSATITGTPAILNIKVPGGLTGVRPMGQPFSYIAAAAGGVGWAVCDVPLTQIRLHRDMLGTTWPAGAAMQASGLFIIGL